MKLSLRLSTATILLGVLFLGRGIAHESGQPGIPLNQLYPGPLGYANFGKIVSGHLTDDLKCDVALMDGSVPKVVASLEVFDNAFPVCPTANDIAVLSGALANPAKDCIVAVSPAGLQRFERDSANAVWNEIGRAHV